MYYYTPWGAPVTAISFSFRNPFSHSWYSMLYNSLVLTLLYRSFRWVNFYWMPSNWPPQIALFTCFPHQVQDFPSRGNHQASPLVFLLRCSNLPSLFQAWSNSLLSPISLPFSDFGAFPQSPKATHSFLFVSPIFDTACSWTVKTFWFSKIPDRFFLI